MNIKQAKEQIKNAMTAYFQTDEYGNPLIPSEKQRPVFLLGAPGIGKTAIMEQVASEMGVGLLSYSMTHHTRQSALGLPFIVHKKYGDTEYAVSEYTMSEIIASVYNMMEETGIKKGILFLDEINCVSETLTPIMLQFLQYKIFGRHRVPNGWIVVTAGNPPEYNDSVREFDMATWDRLKRIDVEPEFGCWKEYAYKTGVHPAVLSYLEIKKDNFYKVESTVDGKSFVTARGWDDLSRIIKVYEQCKIEVDKKLIAQYLQDAKIASDFATYYELFNKYRADYRIEDILAGKASEDIKNRARSARFDERLALIGLLLDSVNNNIADVMKTSETVSELVGILRQFRADSLKGEKPDSLLIRYADDCRAKAENGKKAGSLDAEGQKKYYRLSEILEKQASSVREITDFSKAFAAVKSDFDRIVAELKKSGDTASKKMSEMFRFASEVFGEGQEILVLVTELTINSRSAAFLSKFGCKEYFEHNKNLLFFDRQKEISLELEKYDLQDL